MNIISNCERQFISSCISRQKRLDGREFTQGRDLKIVFGKERGCCKVHLGKTSVFVQVSSELTEPKEFVPNEGILQINYVRSSMPSPNISLSPTSEEFIEVQCLLERCIRDSKCIDLESLCVITASKVWRIRVNIYPLNDDGNFIECASIGAISALSHFKCPEVTIQGNDVIVHSIDEKESVTLIIHHKPITINFAIFGQGKYIIVDPSELEEKVCDGCYIIGMNDHEEICFTHRRGGLLLKEAEIKSIVDIAIKRAQEITQIIRTALDDDAYKRETGTLIGFKNLIQTGTIFREKQKFEEIWLKTIQNMQMVMNDIKHTEDNFDNDKLESSENGRRVIQDRSHVKERALNIQELEAAVSEGGLSKWGKDKDSRSSEEEVMSAETKSDISATKQQLNSDSEEEIVYINKEQFNKKASDKRGWFIKDPFA